ncbi:MAG: hypothetical protein NTW67_02845 [Candidatus Woesearchaeota archaeon]|nr:hypothetical protein [Candidatus Woesearchaeota archaeon]
MKGDYNIKDDELFQALKLLGEALCNTEYFIFGGVGVQARVAALETDNGRKDVKTVDDSKLRRTGDIDLYIADENAVVLFNELAAAYPRAGIVNAPNHVKIGPVIVNYLTSPDELKGFEKVALEQLAAREQVSLRKGNCRIRVDVSPVEHLIAAKLSGNRIQAKDFHDIKVLVDTSQASGSAIRYDAVRQLLVELGCENKYQVLEQIISEEY